MHIEDRIIRVWKNWDKTGVCSDEELDLLIESAEAGLIYLRARNANLAKMGAIMELESLNRIKEARARDRGLERSRDGKFYFPILTSS